MSERIVLSREALSKGKYTRAFAKLTPDQMTALLWLVGEWSIRGGNGHPRAEVALEAIKEFRHEPLSLMEVYALMQDASRCKEALQDMTPAAFLRATSWGRE